MTELHLSIEVDASAEAVFDAARNIDVHAAADRGATKAVGGVTSGMIGLGQAVTWRSHHFGLPWSMTSEITELDRPRRFVDQMVSGPFAQWWHEHLIEPTPAGCRLTDHIRYAAPLGVVGSIVDALFLRRYMTGLIRRHQGAIADAASRAMQ